MAVRATSPRLPIAGNSWQRPFQCPWQRRSLRFSDDCLKIRFFRRSHQSVVVCSAVGEREEERKLVFSDPEVRLIDGLLGIQGRGRSASSLQLKEVEQAVQALENVKGVTEPTSSSLIEGRWQLMFTTRPGTASPIQRTFVGVDGFQVFQEVYLRTGDPRVSNIVRFSDAIGELKVEAEAMIKDGVRILFRFDKAAFAFKALPFKVPYPVPFRLLGDEAKGWLDTTYLSPTGNIRISRGNKGTTFVLQKKTDPRQKLLSAISSGTGVEEAMDELIRSSEKTGAEETLLEGDWQLLWASQLVDGSLSDAVAEGLKGQQIFGRGGSVENSVDVFPGVKLRAYGSLEKCDNSFLITMNNGAITIGSLNLSLDIKRSFSMQLLYIDNKIRITRGYKDIIFIHVCSNRPNKG
ncbi:plastid-lipid associated protein PAP / fibrillin family protein [Wolffia australiana]